MSTLTARPETETTDVTPHGSHPLIDCAHATLLAVVGVKAAAAGIDWATIAAGIGSAALFLQALAKVMSVASSELRAWVAATKQAPTDPPKVL